MAHVDRNFIVCGSDLTAKLALKFLQKHGSVTVVAINSEDRKIYGDGAVRLDASDIPEAVIKEAMEVLPC